MNHIVIKPVKALDESKDLYTIDEIMAILGKNRDTIYRYVHSGLLESIKIGRDHKITKESLKRLIGQ